MKRDLNRISVKIALICVLLLAGKALAQGFPEKPVRVIVPYAPGGTVDVLARAVGQKLAELWNQAFVVENIAGANGIVGTETAARAAKDGYTLLAIAGSNHLSNRSLRKLNYDPVKDFTGVAVIGSAPLVLSIDPSLPVRNVSEFAAIARAKPGTLNYGSTGSGSPTHLSMELFKIELKLDIVHVPYKGAPQVLAALLSGEVAASFLAPTSALPQARSGKLRLLAVTTLQRLETMPDLPTFIEQGIAGVPADHWIGLLGPSGMPQPVAVQLNAAIAKVRQLPDIQSRSASLGITLRTADIGVEEFNAKIAGDAEIWDRAVRESGAKVE